mmetsp:Transcript_40814/g.89258  ORF Transcript_40814/g.89258 Transcript_40814/m.89258 type:complete len:226 (+) Transcript_40814:1469-2146(+)
MTQLKLGGEVCRHFPLVFLLKDFAHLPSYTFGNFVNVLRLDHCLQPILEDSCKVRLQLTAAEVSQDLLPVRRRVILPQVGLQLAGQDGQRCGLPNAVGAYEAQDLSWTRHRQPVQLEGIGAIPMRRLRAQVLGQVDDGDGLEGALLHADTTADAEGLRNPGDLRILRDLNAQLACTDHWAKLLALLLALLRLTSVRADDGNTKLSLIAPIVSFLPHCWAPGLRPY